MRLRLIIGVCLTVASGSIARGEDRWGDVAEVSDPEVGSLDMPEVRLKVVEEGDVADEVSEKGFF